MDSLSIILQVLLPSFVSFLLILMFRKVDRDRFHLSKIKKFTDSVLNQLGNVIQDKEKDVRNQVIELEELIKKSQLLGEYLSDQIAVIDKRVDGLQNQDGLFQHIDSQLERITEINKNVNDNIKTLQNDETETKEIVERVKFVKNTLLDMEKKVPDIEKGLLAGFQKDIDLLKNGFNDNLNELSLVIEGKGKEMIHNLDKEIKQQQEAQNISIDKSSKRLDHFNLNLRAAEESLYQTRDKILNETNERYQDFSLKLNEDTLEYNSQIKMLDERMGHIESDFKLSIERYIQDVNVRIDGFSNFLDKIDKTAQDLEVKLLNELDEKIYSISENANNKIEVLRDNLRNAESQVDEFMKNSNDSITENMNQMANGIEQEKKALENKVNDLEMNLVNFGTNLKGRFTKDIEQLNQSIEEDRKKFNKQSNNIGLYLDNFMDSEKERISKEIEGIGTKFSEDVKELERMTTGLKKAQDDIKKELEQNANASRQNLDGLHSNLKEKISQSFEELHYKIEDEKKTVTRIYDSLKSSMEHLHSSAKDRIYAESESLSSMIEEKKEEITLFYEHNKSIVQDKNKELDYMLSGIKDYYNSELERVIQAIKANYDKTEQDYIFNNTRLLKNTEAQVKEVSKELDILQDTFKSIAEASVTGMEEQMSEYKRDFMSMVGDLDQHVREKEEKIISRIDDKANDLSKRVNEIEGQVVDIKDNAVRDMGRQANEIQVAVGRLEQKYSEIFDGKVLEYENRLSEISDYLNQLRSDSHKEFEKSIHIFKDRADKMGRELENKMIMKVDKSSINLKLTVEKMESEVNTRVKAYIDKTEMKVTSLDAEIKRIRDYDISVDEFNQRFDRELQRVTNELTGMKDKLGNDTKEEYKRITQELQLIDERIEAFTKESRIFKKADKFYDKLKEEIEQAGNQIKRIREEKDYLSDFENKVSLMVRERDELAAEVAKVEAKKGELNKLSAKVDHLIKSSNEADNRLGQINQDMNILDQFKNRIEELNESYQQAESKISEVHDTNSTMGKSIQEILGAKDFIDNLDGRIGGIKEDFDNFSGKNDQMKVELKDLEKRIQFMEKIEGKIEGFMGKFTQMDSFIIDIEKRTDQLEVARKRLTETETRLEDIQNSADHRIAQLSTLVKGGGNGVKSIANVQAETRVIAEAASDISSTSNVATLQRSTLDHENRQEAVIKLYEKGFDIDRISTLLNLSKSEVKLIIDVDKSKAK